MRYRYKRLTGLTRRSIGVPVAHPGNGFLPPQVHTMHDGYVAWVLAFGRKPRATRQRSGKARGKVEA